MWPPIIRIMAELFTAEDYKRTCALISCGASLGTIIVYALAPVCIHFGGWRLIFFASALIAIIMSFVWIKKGPDISVSQNKKSDKNISFKLTPKIFWILSIIVLMYECVLGSFILYSNVRVISFL